MVREFYRQAILHRIYIDLWIWAISPIYFKGSSKIDKIYRNRLHIATCYGKSRICKTG